MAGSRHSWSCSGSAAPGSVVQPNFRFRAAEPDQEGRILEIKSAGALERQGFDGVVYLNRYEGIPLQEIANARDRGIDVNRIPDGVFREAIPSAHQGPRPGKLLNLTNPT
jgi:hypothetical protein